ncbi:MAG: hypothetical protein KAW17_04370 [Candidatus Eisenbacteria sp.]|nr:hypothetical protein [Candidatus Eisenbacteria bacterium]
MLSDTSQQSFSLLAILETLVRRRRFIVVNVTVVVFLAVIISLIVPKWYRTSAVILPPEPSLDPLSTLGALQMTAATASLPWFATTSDVYGAILKSRHLSEEIVDRFDLKHRYKAKTMDKAIKKLWKHCWVRVADEGLIRVTVEAKDPDRAADMANAFLEILDKFNRNTKMTEGKKTRIFVEERLRTTRQDLAEAELTLKEYQQEHGAVELTEQTEALINAAAEIESRIRAIEIRLATLETFATEDNPEVRLLATRKRSLETQMTDLLGSTELAGALLGADGSRPFPSLGQIPDLGMQYIRLFRDVEMQSKIFAFLAQELERAKIMECRDTPTIEVLDRASPPDKKFRPRRWLIVVIAFVTALLGSIALAFGLDTVDRWSQDEQSMQRLSALTRTLREDWSGLRGRGTPRS